MEEATVKAESVIGQEATKGPQPWWESKLFIAALGILAAAVGPAIAAVNGWSEIQTQRAMKDKELAQSARMQFLEASGNPEHARRALRLARRSVDPATKEWADDELLRLDKELMTAGAHLAAANKEKAELAVSLAKEQQEKDAARLEITRLHERLSKERAEDSAQANQLKRSLDIATKRLDVLTARAASSMQKQEALQSTIVASERTLGVRRTESTLAVRLCIGGRRASLTTQANLANDKSALQAAEAKCQTEPKGYGVPSGGGREAWSAGTLTLASAGTVEVWCSCLVE